MALDAADIPETFFVFVNLLNPMTAHNARLVGSFTSSAWTSAVEDEAFLEKYLSGNVDYLPFIPNPSSDQKFLSAYHVRATSDYTNEYNAELTRRAEFPVLPSRLSATYAFGDYATCETVAKKHDWSLSEVEEFQLVSGAPLTRVATVNIGDRELDERSDADLDAYAGHDQRGLAALLVGRRIAPDGAAGRGLQATRDRLR